MIRRVLITVLIFACFLSHESMAMTLEAKALLERTDLFVGEPVILQIQVSGSKKPEKPDLSHVKNFTVEFKGGQKEIVRSDTLRNAKETQNVWEVYNFYYKISPRYEGRLIIPGIDVFADGYATRTKFIAVNVRKPVDSEDFKLRLKLSKPRCYVGEPVILTATWYVGKNVKDYHFDMPLLEDNHFRFADPEVDRQSSKKKYRIPFGDIQVIGEKGHGLIDGEEFTTITFSKILIPITGGNVTIEPATISFSTPVGNQKPKNTVGDNPFPDFVHDDFEVYRNVAVHSNSLTLLISELPKDGRSSHFTCHVGPYGIKAAASPTKVSVGDPITLTLSLFGPDYVGHVDLPDLTQQSKLTRDFKIPKDWATAKISGKTKIFTLTIRPINSSVKEIPPVELPHFDTEKGKYMIAKSNPIPITVKEAKVIRPFEVEGISDITVAGNDIETWSKGIVFNYEDMSVLEKQYLSPLICFWAGLWPVLVFSSPIIFILLLSGVTIHRKRNNDPIKEIARKALNRLKNTLKEAEDISPENISELVLDSFREYLGIKFGMPSGGSITFSDARQKLESLGVESDIIERLKALFESCEIGRYGGNITFKDSDSLVTQAISIAEDLEKRLK